MDVIGEVDRAAHQAGLPLNWQDTHYPRVICDERNNSAEDRAAGRVNVTIVFLPKSMNQQVEEEFFKVLAAAAQDWEKHWKWGVTLRETRGAALIREFIDKHYVRRSA